MGGAAWVSPSFHSLLPSLHRSQLARVCFHHGHSLSRALPDTEDRLLHFAPLSSPLQSPVRRGRPCALSKGSLLRGEDKGDPLLSVKEEESSTSSPPASSLALFAESMAHAVDMEAQTRMQAREAKRKAERTAYFFAAVASTVGITFLTAGAVYYRFAWQTQGAEVPLTEMFGTFCLAVGASVGMEFWARWAHRALWHDSLWSMHESHHQPRDGPFETNDIFAIINAVPAVALISYGFFHKGLVPGLCFGAGLGITVFGIAYMFVHDGLVHRRFPVGPIADVPYFQKVAAAHQLHHADKFKGVPYGLFLGPKELENEEGGAQELEKMMQLRKRKVTPED